MKPQNASIFIWWSSTLSCWNFVTIFTLLLLIFIYKSKTVKIWQSKLGNKKWLNSRLHHQRPISDSWKSEQLKKNLPTHSKTKQLVHYFLLLLLSSSLVLNERKSYSQWNKSSMLWPNKVSRRRLGTNQWVNKHSLHWKVSGWLLGPNRQCADLVTSRFFLSQVSAKNKLLPYLFTAAGLSTAPKSD